MKNGCKDKLKFIMIDYIFLNLFCFVEEQSLINKTNIKELKNE